MIEYLIAIETQTETVHYIVPADSTQIAIAALKAEIFANGYRPNRYYTSHSEHLDENNESCDNPQYSEGESFEENISSVDDFTNGIPLKR